MSLIHTLTSLFGSLALLAIVAAGITMMFAPRAGKTLLQNILVAIMLFVIGSILLQAFWPFCP